MADASFSEVIQVVIQAVVQNDTGKLFAAVGVGSLCMGGYAIYKAVNTPPLEVTKLQKVLMAACCAAGAIALVIGSTISFIVATKKENEKKFVKEIVPPSEAFKRLENNKRVSWLIRIIIHDQNDNSLDVNKLSTIGRSEQKFTFVADYDELRGRTASEAAKMLGMQISETDRVSAIIFPVGNRKIYPVNARGLLQVISAVNAGLEESKRFDLSKRLSPDDINALALNRQWESTRSYSWDNYKSHYPQYCQAVQIFRCSPTEQAISLIGDITDDWHPLGFARRQPLVSVDPCLQSNQYCSITNWAEATKDLLPVFGARVFLMKNVDVFSLKSRVLIEFGQPDTEKVPYLYLPDVVDDFQGVASAE